jgi:hypothetical protein
MMQDYITGLDKKANELIELKEKIHRVHLLKQKREAELEEVEKHLWDNGYISALDAQKYTGLKIQIETLEHAINILEGQ